MSVRSFEQNEASSEDRSFGVDGAEAPKGYKVWRVDLAWTSTEKGHLGQDAEAAPDAPKETLPASDQPRR